MPRKTGLPFAAALVLVLFALDLRVQPGGAFLTRAVDDVGQLVAAAVAGACGVWRARRSVGRVRLSWYLIGLGAACWAIGEGFWSYYELISGNETPFPSYADAGYLLFPVLAFAGVVVRPSRAFARNSRLRITIDSVLVVAALFLVSWATALGSVYAGGADSWLGTVVGLAYPGTDVVLLTVVVIAISYARVGARQSLVWIATGLVGFAIADSGFAYLTAIGDYHTGSPVDLGWAGGFLVLCCAAVLDQPTSDTVSDRGLTPPAALLLPYLPAMAGLVAALWEARDGQVGGVVMVSATVMVWMLVFRQIVVLLDNRSLMARISHQAFHDDLTGLANRALFADRLAHALDLRRRDMRAVTVMLIDLDDFKNVNDSLGHPAGDELLVRVSERLLAVVRTGDTVSRFGGDEFAVLMEDGGDPIELASRLLTSLDQAVVLGCRTIPVGASIGIVTLRPEDPPATCTEMLKRVDVAMYAAKRAGKSTLCVYSDDLGNSDEADHDLRAALSDDLVQGGIDVEFQPIQLADGRLLGFETLARWSHHSTPVSPSTFLPLARRLGAVATLDEIVVGKAAREAMRWGDDHLLSVNLDGETLSDPTFADRFVARLALTGLPARRVVVEVLETSLVEHDTPALDTLARLRSAGVQIAVDDFGAGYASLARLQALRPDIVKIDRSLVSTYAVDGSPAPLLGGIAHLAHQIGALVVAEGIETAAQLDAALSAGCDAVQGHLLGRPSTADQCMARVVRDADLQIEEPASA